MLKTPVKRALISVSDKTHILNFAKGLAKLNIEIISTGGTGQLLRDANIPVKEVSDVTNFPEMMNGRVKTLHPKIFGGILGRRNEDATIAEKHDIGWIDLVVVNLYPFAETIKNPNVTLEEAIENIDIGGPSLIRSAAKNREWVGVVVDPNDYSDILLELESQQGLKDITRNSLAAKAFSHTAQYDSLIHRFLEGNPFPTQINLSLEKSADLRYGENPHQSAAAYRFANQSSGVLSAKQHQGKQLSYNNIFDTSAALACAQDFSEPACVIVKHGNPCGVAVADHLSDAFQLAFHADPQSAFGGIVVFNRPCTEEVAHALNQSFFEVILAPEYSPEALAILSEKTNLRVLELPICKTQQHEFRFIDGGCLLQNVDDAQITLENLKTVTKRKPTAEEIKTMFFSWKTVKHIKSNAILIAKDNVTVGIGAGQVSRVDAVQMAIHKAGKDFSGTVLASDAFFPFRDSIEHIAKTGIKAIIQPGGSMRDEEVIEACDEYGIAMVFTQKRCFKH